MPLLLSFLILMISLCAVLVAASLFTNGIEWLGKKLNLSEGAVGSVLAAVGTALPEAMIPIVALISGHDESSHVGIGAILGAPFMLSTLAFLVVGLSAQIFRQRKQGPVITVDPSIFQRDIRFFLIVFAMAAAVSFVPLLWIRYAVAFFLIILYIIYVYHTIQDGKKIGESEIMIKPLYLVRKADNPATLLIIIQLILALVLMVGGARFFVNALIDVAHALNVSTLLLSLIITPIATELPEKFNSIFWMRDGKDTLALGNITGAMVFQSSVVPSLGIAFTSWELSLSAVVSVVLALLSSFIVFYSSVRRGKLTANVLIFSGSFYLIFLAYVLIGGWLGWPVQ
jgi:cation:H+ antiporter